ncbi:hypothetical protein MA16_Dca019301 [Dendrobium catenatum]|uniref:Uncharacterized protein n=1 Tax=Dendrobium catenatum TaxID=906689 RepID=A0A2I0VJ91_9ASPA|nr:hypothetical protein MA16_Dca019301 [Dendrobium catenatum]
MSCVGAYSDFTSDSFQPLVHVQQDFDSHSIINDNLGISTEKDGHDDRYMKAEEATATVVNDSVSAQLTRPLLAPLNPAATHPPLPPAQTEPRLCSRDVAPPTLLSLSDPAASDDANMEDRFAPQTPVHPVNLILIDHAPSSSQVTKPHKVQANFSESNPLHSSQKASKVQEAFTERGSSQITKTSNVRAALTETAPVFSLPRAPAFAQISQSYPLACLKSSVIACSNSVEVETALEELAVEAAKRIKRQLVDHGNGEIELNANYIIFIGNVFPADVNMPCLNSIDKIDSVQCTQTVRRNFKDKELVMQWLRKSSNEHPVIELYRNISPLSIVGHGGIRETTLLQHVYEDEMTEEFDLKLWGCVFNNFDVDKIIEDEFRVGIQKRFAVLLLYGGVEAGPPCLAAQTDGSKNNLEEAILLLMILLKKWYLGQIQWDTSLMDHFTFALSQCKQTIILSRHIEEVLPGMYPRRDRWYTLSLCLCEAGHDEEALNLLRKVLHKHENPGDLRALLFAAKICSKDCLLASEGIYYSQNRMVRHCIVNDLGAGDGKWEQFLVVVNEEDPPNMQLAVSDSIEN